MKHLRRHLISIGGLLLGLLSISGCMPQPEKGFNRDYTGYWRGDVSYLSPQNGDLFVLIDSDGIVRSTERIYERSGVKDYPILGMASTGNGTPYDFVADINYRGKEGWFIQGNLDTSSNTFAGMIYSADGKEYATFSLYR